MLNKLWIITTVVEDEITNGSKRVSVYSKLYVGTEEESVGKAYTDASAKHPYSKITVLKYKISNIDLLKVIEAVVFSKIEWKAVLETYKEQINDE